MERDKHRVKTPRSLMWWDITAHASGYLTWCMCRYITVVLNWNKTVLASLNFYRCNDMQLPKRLHNTFMRPIRLVKKQISHLAENMWYPCRQNVTMNGSIYHPYHDSDNLFFLQTTSYQNSYCIVKMTTWMKKIRDILIHSNK